MKLLLNLFILLITISINAQLSKMPKNVSSGDSYVSCEIEGKGMRWFKIINTPTPKRIKKIQNKLNYLGYKVVETSILDLQTKTRLKQFNKENNLGNHEMLLNESEKLIGKLYKKKNLVES